MLSPGWSHEPRAGRVETGWNPAEPQLEDDAVGGAWGREAGGWVAGSWERQECPQGAGPRPQPGTPCGRGAKFPARGTAEGCRVERPLGLSAVPFIVSKHARHKFTILTAFKGIEHIHVVVHRSPERIHLPRLDSVL